MHQPEQPASEPEPAPLHRLFEELEAEFDAGLRREAEQEAVAELRARLAETRHWEALARRLGAELLVHTGSRSLRGLLVASYPDFCVLRSADNAQHLVPYGPATSISLPLRRLPPQPVPPASHYRFPLALRELARRREPVRLELAHGAMVAGTIELVGADYLELAEHDPSEARRETALTGRRLISFVAIAIVSLLPDLPGCR